MSIYILCTYLHINLLVSRKKRSIRRNVNPGDIRTGLKQSCKTTESPGIAYLQYIPSFAVFHLSTQFLMPFLIAQFQTQIACSFFARIEDPFNTPFPDSQIQISKRKYMCIHIEKQRSIKCILFYCTIKEFGLRLKRAPEQYFMAIFVDSRAFFRGASPNYM